MLDTWLEQFENKRTDLNKTTMILEKEFVRLFKDERVIITSRVKDKDSLKEKILRRKYLASHSEEECIFDFLKDGMGLRIMCLDHNEEVTIYKKLKKLYEEGKFTEKITFDKTIIGQPQKQENGHDIYRINGTAGNFYFEVQIKSLTHMLWGEMEHLLKYKNYNCSIGSKYVEVQIEQLYIDLIAINNRITALKKYSIKNNVTEELNEIKEISKTILQRKCADFIRLNHHNVNLDFRILYDAIIDYYYNEYNFIYCGNKKRKRTSEYDIYSKMCLSLEGLLSKINSIKRTDINIEINIDTKKIIFEKESLESKIFESLKINLEQDVWSLFFCIIAYLNNQELTDYIYVFIAKLKNYYSLFFNFDDELIEENDRTRITDVFSDKYVESLLGDMEFNFINEIFMEKMKEIIYILFEYIIKTIDYFRFKKSDQNNIIDLVYDISTDWALNSEIEKKKIEELLEHFKIIEEDRYECMKEFDDKYLSKQDLIDILGGCEHD